MNRVELIADRCAALRGEPLATVEAIDPDEDHLYFNLLDTGSPDFAKLTIEVSVHVALLCAVFLPLQRPWARLALS